MGTKEELKKIIKEQPAVIVYKENLFQSVIMDSVTFVMFGAGFYLNYLYLGNTWFVALVLFFMTTMQIYSFKPNYKFYDIEDAIAYLKTLRKK